MKVFIAFACVFVALSGMCAPQSPCSGWTLTGGWSILGDVNTVHGAANPGAPPLTNGPEDIAYNAVTNTLFVVQDNPNSTPDILVQYTLDGRFLGGAEQLPGNGGLCALANGNLLLAHGSVVVEIDTSGSPVPGGISFNLGGYGNIQDLDFDASGFLWIHNGNSGDWSILDTVTGMLTPQFVTPFGTQGFCFRGDNGNILAAGAFFNSGTIGTNTLVEIDPATGSVVCQGMSASSQSLVTNGDTCAGTTPTAFPLVNGMTWITPLKELAIDSFGLTPATPLYGQMNVGRFAPAQTGFLAKIGLDGIRTNNGLPLRIFSSGDAVLGATGFQIKVENADPFHFVAFGAGTMRDCTNPVVNPITGSTLYMTPFPPTGFFLILPVGLSGSLSIPVALISAPAILAGTDFFVQFLTTQLG